MDFGGENDDNDNKGKSKPFSNNSYIYLAKRN